MFEWHPEISCKMCKIIVDDYLWQVLKFQLVIGYSEIVQKSQSLINLFDL